MSHFVILPFFAILLSGRGGALAIVVIAQAYSSYYRQPPALLSDLKFSGSQLSSCFLAARKWTSWKGRVMMIGLVAIAFIAPAAVSSLQKRFAQNK